MSEPRPNRPALGMALLLAGLPGGLFGAHLGLLLFFLNPDVPLTPGRLFAALTGGVLACGAFTAVVVLGLVGRGARLWRLLPWGLTIALVLAALLDSSHASHYAFYLPPRINDQLLRATAWHSLAALICFYTALLHTLGRRPYGWRSRAAFWLLCCGSLPVAYDRRAAFKPLVVEALPIPLETASERPNLVVVGIDTLSLDALLPLAEEGGLPFLSAALADGAYGPLRSFRPSRHRALWTTVATGQFPFRHGIVGAPSHWAPLFGPDSELRLLPAGLGFQRWGLIGARTEPEDPARHLRSIPLPELLARLGVTTGSVGWPASTPRSAPLAWEVSDRFFVDEASTEVAPSDLAARARLFAVSAEELDPRWTERLRAAPSPVVVAALREDQWRVSLTEALRREALPHALFLHLSGLGRVSEAYFPDFSAGRLASPSDATAEAAALELSTQYRYLSEVLDQLWRETPPPRLFAIVSANGPLSPGFFEGLWRQAFGGPPLGGAVGSSPDGVLLLLGDQIRPGTLLTGARAVDLVPTLLYGLDLPVARDLDGRVLTEAFRSEYLDAHPLAFVPTYRGLLPPAKP